MLKTQSMNLDYIRTFVIVGQSKDLTDAASKLNIDPTNVSRHIKALEEIMQTKLLNRNQKTFELTEDGKKLFEGYEKAYNMMLLAEKTYTQSKSLNSGKLTIGISPEMELGFANDKIKNFKSKYPNVVVKIITLPTQELYEKLSQFYVDFIIDTPVNNFKKSSNIKVKELFLDQYCIAYSPQYFKIELNSIKDLMDLPLILPITSKTERKMFDELVKKENISKNLSLEIDNYESIMDYIDSGLGFGLVPKRYITDNEYKTLDIDLNKEIIIAYIPENLSESAKMLLNEFE